MLSVIVRVQIVDLAIFILIGFYALWLLNFLKGLHPPEIQTAFSTPSLVVSLCPRRPPPPTVRSEDEQTAQRVF